MLKRPRKITSAVAWRVRATRRLWSPAATMEMTALPRPLPLPDGRIDSPEAGSELPREPVAIEGWATFPSGPPARVEVWLGERLLGRARLGLGRPDLPEATGDPRAAVCGFALDADLDEHAGSEGPLRAVATGARGERLELAAVPLRVAERRPDPQPRPKRRVRSGNGDAPRLLVFAHQLDLGGAQTYLLQTIEGLLRRGGLEPAVISAFDGPLRGRLEGLGVPVHVSTPVPQDELEAHLDRVGELTAWAANGGFDAVLVNTASAFALPGAEVAANLGLPAVWAIHESFPLSILWAELHPGVRRIAEQALAGASLAIFEAEATERLFASTIGAERCLTMPYGLDLRPIDAARAGFDRDAARSRRGIGAGADVLLCAGSIEPRKGQVPLARAFDLIADRHPAATLVFVGGRQDRHTRLLERWVSSLRSAGRIRVLPLTPEIDAWYGLADALVCASDIESLPRTVLEAMAWQLPVLATDVFGLPELIEDGESGWLCRDRDVIALATALDRVLSTPAARGHHAEWADGGRSRAADLFGLSLLQAAIAPTAAAAASGPAEGTE
jgi:D-inositol-3-phosphate glycosyltransferase